MPTDQEQIIRQMVDDLREVVFQTDAQGRFTFLNAAWQEITGFAVPESLGKFYLDSLHPDDREGSLERLRSLVERQTDATRHDVRCLKSDGTYCWADVKARVILDESGALTGTCGTIANISDRHAAIEALRCREAVLEAIGEIAQSFLQGKNWATAIPSALERLGPAAGADRILVVERVAGPGGHVWTIPRHEWHREGVRTPPIDVPMAQCGPCWLALERGEVVAGAADSFPPGVQAILDKDAIRHIAIVPILAGGDLWGNISFVRKSDIEWAPATVEGLRVAAGIVGAAIRQSASQEILRLAHTELEERVEERTRDLKRSEQRFHAIFDEAPIGMLLIDEDDRIQFTNGSFQRMLERTAEELTGAAATSISHPDDRTASARLLQSVRSSARGVERIEKRYLAKSGREVWARATIANLCKDPDGRTFTIAMVEDVTGRKQLEEEFLHAQRMEAVGCLTSGIAHDFNNILTVIKGYGELLLKGLVADQRAFRKVGQIVKAAERASSLVNQLLAFSRKRAVGAKVLDVNAALREMQGMLRRLLREDIDLVTYLDPELGSAKIDPGQFGQLVMNLAVNARDAIPGAGTVTIATRPLAIDQETAHQHPKVLAGRYTVLEVSDTGCGMAPEVRTRIFEPFFTTKDIGKGTGLGLSTVYGIVQQAGGFISVASALGVGTAFRIHLPVAVEEGPAIEPAPGRTASTGGAETVLIAEDEDEVRTFMAETLRGQGYTVVEARNGIEALRAADRHEGLLNLLLTDVVMPHMGGPELCDNLWERFPDMRCLFTSGYAGADLERAPALLHKPFSSGDLIARVREILDAPRPTEFTVAVLPSLGEQ